LEDLNEVDIDNGRRHCTKKAKGAANNRDATNVGFYPSLWQKLLDRAKANFRLYIATSVPFPDKEQSIGGTGVCGEVIAEAIVQWQEQKRKLEKGIFFLALQCYRPLTYIQRLLPRVQNGDGYCGERSKLR
jgi:hypothetical protein